MQIVASGQGEHNNYLRRRAVKCGVDVSCVPINLASKAIKFQLQQVIEATHNSRDVRFAKSSGSLVAPFCLYQDEMLTLSTLFNRNRVDPPVCSAVNYCSGGRLIRTAGFHLHRERGDRSAKECLLLIWPSRPVGHVDQSLEPLTELPPQIAHLYRVWHRPTPI